MKKCQLLIFMTLVSIGNLYAQSASTDITGIWQNENQTRNVEVYKSGNNTYEGKIVWVKNPEQQPGVGEVVIKGLVREGKVYKKGKVHAAKAGGWINCEANLQNDSTLRLTASKLIFSKTKIYHRVNK